MFWKSKKSPPNAKPPAKRDTIPSIISKDMNILGNIISDGNIDFNGTIQGNIRCNTLTIRANGTVHGDIVANHVHVYGKVTGLIRVKNAEFYESCRVEGVIMHETLTIEDGAFIDGKFKRITKVQLIEEAENNDEEFNFNDDAGDNGDNIVKPFDTIRLIR